jgi:hypothetical protein
MCLRQCSFQSAALDCLLPRGLEVVGAIYINEGNSSERCTWAGKAAIRMQKELKNLTLSKGGSNIVAASATPGSGEIEYNLYVPGEQPELEMLEVAEDTEDFKSVIWSRLCLLRCQMELALPLYLPTPPSSSGFTLSELIQQLHLGFQLFLNE